MPAKSHPRTASEAQRTRANAKSKDRGAKPANTQLYKLETLLQNMPSLELLRDPTITEH